MSEKWLEERRAWLRSLTQEDREFIARFGFDLYQKKKQLEAMEKEEQERIKQKTIEESKTFTIEEILTEIFDKIDAKPQAKKKIAKLIEETIQLRGEINDLQEIVNAYREQSKVKNELVDYAEKIVEWFEKKGLKLDSEESENGKN